MLRKVFLPWRRRSPKRKQRQRLQILKCEQRRQTTALGKGVSCKVLQVNCPFLSPCTQVSAALSKEPAKTFCNAVQVELWTQRGDRRKNWGRGKGGESSPWLFLFHSWSVNAYLAMQAIPRQEVKFFFPRKTRTFSTYPFFLGYFQINAFSKSLVSLQLTSHGWREQKRFLSLGILDSAKKNNVLSTNPGGYFKVSYVKAPPERGSFFTGFRYMKG